MLNYFVLLLQTLSREYIVKTTIKVDEELITKLKKYTGIDETPKLVQRAVRYIIAYEEAVLQAEKTGKREDLRNTIRRLYDDKEQ